MSNKKFHKCPDCGTEDLEFRAWVDKYHNCSELDENSTEAWCTKCQEIVYPDYWIRINAKAYGGGDERL